METESKKQNVLMVGGGDSYGKREDFLAALKTQPLHDLPGSEPYRSWKQWLIEELGEQYVVFNPKMPNKENAHYDEWKIWFERYVEESEGPLILIGLSLGAMFLAKYLAENDLKREVSGLFLLAGPCGEIDDGAGNDCKSFRFKKSDLPSVAKRAEKIAIMHSKDDPVVPYEHAEMYKESLPNATLHTFETRGHFLVEEFPELLELVRSLGKKTAEEADDKPTD